MAEQNEGSQEEDRRELHRGVVVNFAGYFIKLLHPLLLVLVTRIYGAENWGVFVAAQALLLVLVRVSLLGLDKGVLWWVPRQGEDGGRRSLLKLFRLMAVVLAFVSVGLALSMPQYRLLAFCIFPMGLTDLLIHSTMGKRRMEAQVFIKEALVPLLFVVFASLVSLFAEAAQGLPLAFLLANLMGLLAAWRVFDRLFPPRPGDGSAESVAWPEGLLSYSLPFWMAEISNSVVQRLDILVLTALTDLKTVGIYGIVVQFGNALKSIRRSFDPLVVAISSRISAGKDRTRLIHTFSHATWLVTATQTPVFVFILIFADSLLAFYGPDFAMGADAARLLCLLLLISGPLQLCALVVTGYGKSRLILYDVLAFLALEALLLSWLVPLYGMTGASLAVGVATLSIAFVQLVQMRVVTGGWNYRLSVLEPIVWSLAGGLVVWLLPSVEHELGNRIAQALAFALVFAGGLGIPRWFRKKTEKMNS